MVNKENGLLLVLQSTTMLLAFIVVKINLSHFTIENIGTLNLFTSTIALAAAFRITGIDVCLTRGFREQSGYYTLTGLLIYMAAGALTIVLALLILKQEYFDEYLFSIILIIFAFSMSFDRSTSYYLTHKKYLTHRIFLLISGVLIFLVSLSCYIMETSIDTYIIMYLAVLILVSALKTSLTFKKIFLNLKGECIYQQNQGKISLRNPTIAFSILGILQAFIGNVDRIVIGMHSTELLGIIFVIMLAPSMLKQLTQPLFVKLVYENFSFNKADDIVKNLVFTITLTVASLILGFLLVPIIFDVQLELDWHLYLAATLWLLAGILESIISGRLTLEYDAVKNIKIFCFMALIPITLHIFNFTILGSLNQNGMIWTIALGQLLRSIYVYIKYSQMQLTR